MGNARKEMNSALSKILLENEILPENLVGLRLSATNGALENCKILDSDVAIKNEGKTSSVEFKPCDFQKNERIYQGPADELVFSAMYF